MLEPVLEYLKTNSWVGFACGAILLVLGWKMTATWANSIVVLAWVVFLFSIFRAPLIGDQAVIPRVLWTALIGSALGIVFYNTVWTPKSAAIEPPALTTATGATLNVRVKFSDRQTVEISNIPGDYNDTLNLDNVATMVQSWEGNLEEVGMELITTPPLRIDKPKGKEKYPAGPGDIKMQFPAADEPGIEIQLGRVINSEPGHHFVFNRLTSPIHVISVGTRKFRVTLQDIRDKSDQKKKHRYIQYTFGINEE